VPTAGVSLTTAPGLGSTGAITGRLLLAPPANLMALLYLGISPTQYYQKPLPSAAFPLGPDGSFVMSGWATGGAGDAQAQYFTVYVVPMVANMPNVNGGAIPGTLTQVRH
jgi:hypothetical protein